MKEPYKDPNVHKAQVLRPSVGGRTRYCRIPIRHRQLVYEVENFSNWIAHLIAHNRQAREENPKLQETPNFFDENKTGLLIYAYDGESIIRSEVGTPKIINLIECELRQDLEKSPLVSE